IRRHRPGTRGGRDAPQRWGRRGGTGRTGGRRVRGRGTQGGGGGLVPAAGAGGDAGTGLRGPDRAGCPVAAGALTSGVVARRRPVSRRWWRRARRFSSGPFRCATCAGGSYCVDYPLTAADRGILLPTA